MKIKTDFILRTIAQQNIVIPIGNNIVDFNGIISLNETGAFLWKLMQDEISIGQLIDNLMQEYDVEQQEAEKDIKEFVSLLDKHHILEGKENA